MADEHDVNSSTKRESPPDPSRRRFLKGVGIAGAGAALADHLAQTAEAEVKAAQAEAASATAATSIHACEKSRSRRRSMMSASAPAGSASRKVGAVSAVCISATMMGVGARVVISHSAPTLCIHVPTFEATAAIHSARKSGRRSGAHAELASRLIALLTQESHRRPARSSQY